MTCCHLLIFIRQEIGALIVAEIKKGTDPRSRIGQVGGAYLPQLPQSEALKAIANGAFLKRTVVFASVIVVECIVIA